MNDEKEVVLEFVNLHDGTITDVGTMKKRLLTPEETEEITTKLS